MILCGLTDERTQPILPYLLLAVGSSLAGLIDDIYGSHVERGLAGHLKAFIEQGKVTTGLFKAVLIWFLAAVSVSASADTKPLSALVSDATLISLSANFMNLLDLRPARSGKAFLISFMLLLVGDCRSFSPLVPAGFVGAVLAGIGDELNEKSMMGDAGANPLGAVLGYWVVLRSSPIVKTSVLLLLIGVHIYSERRSLSITIDANPVLRFIDLLGRSRKS
jgi:UDP-GlcNAc:undecaprenyl-phosphate GlcNAc-1-phosphate transferase